MAGEAALVKEAFGRIYGSSESVRTFSGPGRVNLIGEHTDYNLGFVLPMALDLACFTAAGPNHEGKLRVFTNNYSESREWEVSSLANVKPAGHWSDYIAGVALELIRAGIRIEPKNLLTHSTVPVGSGLSSSAALEVSTALALLGDQKMDGLELALLCRRAENNFVGTPCGIMDQYVSVFGKENSAIKIDCRSLRHDTITLPAGVEIIAVNTMVKHELGQSAYRQRVQECGEAVRFMAQRAPRIESLRDVQPDEFNSLADGMPAVVKKRARHVVTEDARVEEFGKASRQHNLREMGELFFASHRSLQHDYEVSCEELDFLVDTASSLPGVYGARMTGGGFGGCTVNLLQTGAGEEFRTRMQQLYTSRFGVTPQIYDCKPSPGASEIS